MVKQFSWEQFQQPIQKEQVQQNIQQQKQNIVVPQDQYQKESPDEEIRPAPQEVRGVIDAAISFLGSCFLLTFFLHGQPT